MRKMHKDLPVIFKPEKWSVTEESFCKESNAINETVFCVANGYLGLRGIFEEGFYDDPKFSDPAIMINGVYEFYDYHHLWARPGFPLRSNNLVRQTNPLQLNFFADGEAIKLGDSARGYKRVLHMDTGVMSRSFTFATKSGASVTVNIERFASQTNKHLFGLKATLISDKDVNIKTVSTLSNILNENTDLSSPIGNLLNMTFLNVSKSRPSKNTMQVLYKTKRSEFVISCAFTEKFNGEMTKKDSADTLKNEYDTFLKAGEPLIYERVGGFATMRDFDDFEYTLAQMTLLSDYENLKNETNAYWKGFWKDSDVSVNGDDLIQQGIRYSIFHTNQSTGKDGITNISANGLAGVAYSGHIFWDTEIFIMPMFLYSRPEVAKQLLMYRYNILPKARERAKQMEDEGALYSWNSINGEECGTVFEAATAQYHIDNDIFYAIFRYMEATGDEEFLTNYGAEMIFETARCMAHRGSFIEARGGKFCINVICGPDEYTPLVDNNCYTNYLTRKHLEYALEVEKLLKTKYPSDYKRLFELCHLTKEELALWKKAAENMYLPYNTEYDMYMQDDQFMYRDPVDVDAIPRDRIPMLFTYHPLNLWRKQVSKQADLVLLTYLYSYEFSHEMKKKIFEYMEPRTIHESSLSAGIHAIVACDIGLEGEAYGFTKQSCRMDLENYNGNTHYGIHAACMGSAWMMLVNGYAGMRIYNGKPNFKPFCPPEWKSYSFSIKFRCCRIQVTVTPQKAEYILVEGDNAVLTHNGKEISLNFGCAVECDIK